MIEFLGWLSKEEPVTEDMGYRMAKHRQWLEQKAPWSPGKECIWYLKRRIEKDYRRILREGTEHSLKDSQVFRGLDLLGSLSQCSGWWLRSWERGYGLILSSLKHELKVHLFGNAERDWIYVNLRVYIPGIRMDLSCWDHVLSVLYLDSQ